MKTQKGVTLPDDLASKLEAQPHLLTVLDKMRPSCQQGYVDWVSRSEDSTAREQRIGRVLTKISKWGAKHNLIALEGDAQQSESR